MTSNTRNKTITASESCALSQSEINSLKARENVRFQIEMAFVLALYWLKKWREIFLNQSLNSINKRCSLSREYVPPSFKSTVLSVKSDLNSNNQLGFFV